VAADGGSIFLIVLLGMADRVELVGRGKHASSEPNSIPLHPMRDHIHLDRGRLLEEGKILNVCK